MGSGNPPSPLPNMRAPRNVSDYLYQCAQIGVTFLLQPSGELEAAGPEHAITAVTMAGYLPRFEGDIRERLAPAPWDALEFQVLAAAEAVPLDEYEVEERAAILSEGTDISWPDALLLAKRQLRESLVASDLRA